MLQLFAFPVITHGYLVVVQNPTLSLSANLRPEIVLCTAKLFHIFFMFLLFSPIKHKVGTGALCLFLIPFVLHKSNTHII